ncbi:PREDICTED: uncharacterized protein LOC109580363 [Amphimedon queenslandica]|uniref:Fibronectin type-III domain-containing protein n=2 Tax=Amphimedon queenslandica TaxID=400682 RepID=A0AAN0IW38_AMPQE|nr:PREDICTED: uncharacterized protein LOC109580363 [Amphimedon queenslandica]|eukprot:XP_019848974.1 PREDICTED: uncharacterized protein LOC109580363 [Amphimedon queenslandica]
MLLNPILLLLLQYIQSFDCANIIVQPVSINTTLNSTVVFCCEAVADIVTFRINNQSAIDETVIANGFTISTFNNGGTRRAELQAIAYDHNNNTNISCAATTFTPVVVQHSDTVLLMIQGPLDDVSNLNYTIINGSSVLLTWTAPYTLDNVPITGYYIVVNELESSTTNNTNITLSTSDVNPCVFNNASVSPMNDVGIGSPNSISFYYERVPFSNFAISVTPVVERQLVLLYITIDVSTICEGEYPNNIAATIMTTNNTIISSTSISTIQVNDDMMITGIVTIPNNLSTFMVNVSLSNSGGEFLPTPPFVFGVVGPVTNVTSSIDCTSITITWKAPTVDNGISIEYYNLSIYDDVIDQLLMSVPVYNTSYQFVDNNLFIYRYAYVITGVNVLGEGISTRATFSYQRVPRSANETTVSVELEFAQELIIKFSIHLLGMLMCTGEAPNSATVAVQCNGSGSIYSNSYMLKYTNQPSNITGLALVPLNQQCNFSVVFSNNAGSSKPFVIPLDTFHPYPTNDITTTTQLLSPTTQLLSPTSTPASTSLNAIAIITPAVLGAIIIILLLIILILVCIVISYKKKENRSVSFQQQAPVVTSYNEAYQFNTLMINNNNNPAYEEIKLT